MPGVGGQSRTRELAVHGGALGPRRGGVRGRVASKVLAAEREDPRVDATRCHPRETWSKLISQWLGRRREMERARREARGA